MREALRSGSLELDTFQEKPVTRSRVLPVSHRSRRGTPLTRAAKRLADLSRDLPTGAAG
jgi:hypothetical protein